MIMNGQKSFEYLMQFLLRTGSVLQIDISIDIKFLIFLCVSDKKDDDVSLSESEKLFTNDCNEEANLA